MHSTLSVWQGVTCPTRETVNPVKWKRRHWVPLLYSNGDTKEYYLYKGHYFI